jgi:hypothetical protein
MGRWRPSSSGSFQNEQRNALAHSGRDLIGVNQLAATLFQFLRIGGIFKAKLA